MPYILGVDGGNTKTIALIATLDGRIIGSGRSGCGDIYHSFSTSTRSATAVTTAINNITDAVTQALQHAQITLDQVLTSVFNLAGADWPEDFALLQAAMQERHFGQTIVIQNDALGILHAGSIENIGVSVVCGTGCTTGARGPGGRVWHASFWQGTQGSVDLSKNVLNTVVRAELGLEEPTILTNRVLNYFGLDTVEDVLHTLTRREKHTSNIPRIDGLTPILLDEADAGDTVARRIIQQHGWSLGDYAIVAARRVAITQRPFPLILAGGVFRHTSSQLVDTIVERVRQVAPNAQPARAQFEPIIGVLFSALELSGIPITETVRTQLIATQPNATLFDTRG
ncbi:N-acetylglucosamine kinase [Dictyobacter alpinus]|uniref:N-acetylglucosamine kinase n=1 Tax=Dictyobacter alpinus TaxID=2014873 RepID=A0A402BFX3_9CHLR|nr:BadF/BadG/BcrA/BcrD ATPase family protein [Dictyobacter alpinus]GCE30274.1 N-acetylglucosamine kinase [Dictyobacter alpinus]